MAITKLAAAYWDGTSKLLEKDSVSPLSNPEFGASEEMLPGVLFVLSFANVVAVGAQSDP